MITRTLNFRALRFLPRMRFSGGDHHKVYDWRDDTSVNEGFEQDSREVGLVDPLDYHFPHTAKASEWILSAPADFNNKDLTQNIKNSTRIVQIQNNPSPPETDWMADVAHEKDYESEDLDFQPESFETQHFRKKGPIYMWIWVGLFPITFFACEFFFQGWVDDDNYRFQRPPPLMYPDEDDTPDPEDFLVFQTPEYNEWWDAGILKRP